MAVALFETGTVAGALAIAAFTSGNVPTSNHPVVTRVGLTVLSVRVPYATTLFVIAPEAFVNPPAIENRRLNWVHGVVQLNEPPVPRPTPAIAPPPGVLFTPAGGTTLVHPLTVSTA